MRHPISEHSRVLCAREDPVSQHETLSCTRQKANTIVERALDFLALPWRCFKGFLRNNHDVLRVLDLTLFHKMSAGMVSLDHPWVTGIDPQSQQLIWNKNVIFRSSRSPQVAPEISDEKILYATGKFLTHRVRHSAILPEIPQGPERRMPHAINYMHGSSHFNSGIILLNNLTEGFRYFTDRQFQRELKRFVAEERREILVIFRDRNYSLQEFAWFSCCLRQQFSWFCNPNGPRGNVLWGNFSPYPVANLITGAWASDVYRLFSKAGADAVIRRPIDPACYFQDGPYDAGRSNAVLSEKMMACFNHLRVKMRGARGGLRFVDRRRVFADQIQRRLLRGNADLPLPDWNSIRPATEQSRVSSQTLF